MLKHDAVFCRCGPTDEAVFCVHSRLHPGITWSHTAGSPCYVPPLSHTGKGVALHVDGDGGGAGGGGRAGRHDGSIILGSCLSPQGVANEGASILEGHGVDRPLSVAAADFGVLTFVRGEGTGEWNYPWDLTGGLYR